MKQDIKEIYSIEDFCSLESCYSCNSGTLQDHICFEAEPLQDKLSKEEVVDFFLLFIREDCLSFLNLVGLVLVEVRICYLINLFVGSLVDDVGILVIRVHNLSMAGELLVRLF